MAKDSIFIITVDARPKLQTDEFDLEEMTARQRELFTARTYRDWFGPYVEENITRQVLARSHVGGLFYSVITERIRETLAIREEGLQYSQLFNYMYQDGAPMLTIGGIVTDPQDEIVLQQSGILEHRFIRTSREFLEISVPPLTIREKQWLDSRLDKKLTAKKIVFELEDDLLSNYRTFYREYPAFVEMLL
jgi:hypothetical protein